VLTPISIGKLEGVHPDLVKVAMAAAEACHKDGLEFQITEGVRTVARQRLLLAKGATTTMKSRHLTGDAFDFVPVVDGEMCWKWPAFWPIVEHIEAAAKALGIAVECGARWKKFPDGPHVQRPWSA
jgi:peptidoglycan L-alanyl-D-glutamate endopeptidase CwlK